MSQLVCRPQGGAGHDLAQSPVVTVLISVRNEEAHLRECLQGLMEQSVAGSVEVIVVDQGSQQAEWAIVADLQKHYRNITAVRTANTLGAGAGWNLAGRIARGKYLMALSPSDRLKKDALELLCMTLEKNPEAAFSYGDTCFTALPHQSFENHASIGKMIWPDYTVEKLSRLSLTAPHLMWRRQVHEAIGWFREETESQPLHDFLLRVVRQFRTVHLETFIGLQLVASEQVATHRFAKEEPWQEQPFKAAAGAVKETAEDTYDMVQKALEAGDDRRAAEALRRYLAQYPDHATAHNDLAALSYRLGDVDGALTHYQAAVRLAPQESTFRKNLADLYFVELGRSDEAISIYLKLLEEAPGDVETLLNLGIISETINHPREAELFYQRGLEIEPWNQTLRERLTELHDGGAPRPEGSETPQDRYARVEKMVADGLLAEATRELERIVGSYPGFASAHNDLAVLSYQSGDKEKARLHYEKAAELDPDNSVFRRNLADFYFLEATDVDGAIAIYLEELQKDPRDVETLMSLGKICSMLQKEEEARTFYGRALELEPWNREAREMLAEL